MEKKLKISVIYDRVSETNIERGHEQVVRKAEKCFGKL
jgi:hypothetical protein